MKKIIISISLIVVISAIGFFIISQDDSPEIEYIVAQKKDVVQEVLVTGRVKPSQRVDLAFEKTGKISAIFVDVGDRVFAGQSLILLGDRDEKAKLAQAQARIKIEQAKLDELLAGARSEEVKVAQVKVDNAIFAHSDARKNLIVQIKDAYTKSDNAVRNNVDQFISNAQGTNPQIDFTVTDSTLETTVESNRVAIEVLLVAWQQSIAALTLMSDLKTATIEVENNLDTIKSFLDTVSLLVNMLKTNSTLSQTTIDGYRSDVSSARSAVNTAIGNIQDAEEKEKDEVATLTLAEQQLLLIEAAPRVEQIKAQDAKVEEARATVAQYQSELEKTILLSPLTGIVTVQNTNVGEVVLAQEIVISLISDSQFEIEVNIPEADVAKINIGDNAFVTLDAYGSDVAFNATVVTMDPAETMIDGVATYTTTLQFNKKDERVRSGMTANIEIKTNTRENVFAVPARSVITKNGNKIVRVYTNNNEIVEVPVVIGLRGSDGSIEIIEGISLGDRVIIFLEEK